MKSSITDSLLGASNTRWTFEHRGQQKAKVGLIVLLSVALIVSVVLCGEPVLVMLNGCNDIVHYRQAVDVAPLMDLEIPPNLDLTRWTHPTAARDSIGRVGVFTNIERLPDIETARMRFEIECEYQGDASRNIYGGYGDNRFCLSDVRTVRAGPEGLCRPLGRYSSYIIIQRNTVVIALYEGSDNRASTAMDETIQQLANELLEAMSQ